MEQKLTGLVYDIQPFSVQDGPGIRTTVFLKGCPLRCPWCHSPESQEFFPQLSWVSMRCVGCGRCIGICPRQAISYCTEETVTVQNGVIHRIQIDRSKCVGCGTCAGACYPQALYVSGTPYTPEEVVNKVSGDIPFYNNSGGGVTISGGEPLSQPAFTVEVLRQLKAAGISTALDTTGFAPAEFVKKALSYTDLFLYDLKHMDPERHMSLVKQPNGPILDNARIIARLGGKLQVRIPLITGCNDDDKNLRESVSFCDSIRKSVTVVQLLPFHDLGSAKYPRIGRDDIFTVPPVPEERIEKWKAAFAASGLPVTVH